MKGRVVKEVVERWEEIRSRYRSWGCYGVRVVKLRKTKSVCCDLDKF